MERDNLNNPSALLATVDAAGRDSDQRLGMVVDLVRHISSMTDPQEIIALFRERARQLYGGDGSVSVSRRDLESPYYRITRSTAWKHAINPWTQKDRLPLVNSGILGELLYGDRACILSDVCVSPDDPAFEHLQHARSLVSLPQYDGGEALNMTVRWSSDPRAFDALQLPEAVLEVNLFGRATKSLVTMRELQQTHDILDRELLRVGELQRALLPSRLPEIPGVDIAVHYETADRAGGDYYDFFDLGNGRWGLLIADVSGHGTPAAVLMAVLRTILHAECQHARTPAELLCFANTRLCDRSNWLDGSFITAFYGIYDSHDRTLRYASAGHNPPLLVNRKTEVTELNQAQALPLSVSPCCDFVEAQVTPGAGDTLILYTDGITEATNAAGEMYGHGRLLSCVHEQVRNAQHIIDCVTHKLLAYTESTPLHDDRTLVALRFE